MKQKKILKGAPFIPSRQMAQPPVTTSTPFYMAPIPPAGPMTYGAYPPGAYFPAPFITDPTTGMVTPGVPAGYQY